MLKLVPVILVVLGTLTGGASGYFLKPAPVEVPEIEHQGQLLSKHTKHEENGPEETAFVKLNNQFVVPVMNEKNVSALVVLSITLETTPGETDMLYNIEPKIRDTSLRVLFDHAYIGGFDGRFTASPKLDPLRRGLLDAINLIANDVVRDVLITDIIRQDG